MTRLLLAVGLLAVAPAAAQTTKKPRPTVYTIGYADHTRERFLALLRQSRIELLIDVRSRPVSGRLPYFCRDAMARWLPAAGVGYRTMGEPLGGFPKAKRFYRPDGRVDYDRLARWPAFRAGLDALVTLARRKRVAVMCKEEDPAHCHRNLLVGRQLARRGVRVLHIRADGRVQKIAPPSKSSR
jgi:uncharacterized protein (DUF488 family)